MSTDSVRSRPPQPGTARELAHSEATTAKPRPCSPARAASTAAFERQEVGLTGDLLHDGDLLGDGLHRLDRPAHGHGTARLGILGGLAGDRLGLARILRVLLHVDAISSIEAEASSVDAACSVEPCDSCSAEADSSWLPADTLPAPR